MKSSKILRANSTDFYGATAYALGRLERELPAKLSYHSHWHTAQVVIPAALSLGQLAGLQEEEIRLVETACAFHDIGFIEGYVGHEIAGMRIAVEVLPNFGFSLEDMKRVENMILATRLPQNPRNHLEEIIADADLDVLGRDDFFIQNQALYMEVEAFGRKFSLEKWMEGQVNFISKHNYFTPQARRRRDVKKQANLLELVARLNSTQVD